MTGTERPSPALLRGLTQTRMSRRSVLRGAGAVGGAAAVSALLAACGIQGTSSSSSSGSKQIDWTSWWAKQKKAGVLDFANWPLYIDQDDNGNSASLAAFTKKTGIKVNYKEVIQANDSFYAKISPLLKNGQSIGYDLIVMTNGWELTELIDNGWVAQLDQSKIPNFKANADRTVLSPSYDPGAAHSMVWQTGFTGLAYNEKLTGGPITSFEDLLDPKFAGHIGMFSDTTELGSAALLALGVEPTQSTHADWKKAAAWLKKVQPGVVKFYDQGYTDALQNGDIWISQAWSGDIYQVQAGGHEEIKYVTPKEGQMMWHDNMLIPITAEHPLDALTWMDYYYQPAVAGVIEDYVNYVCPVPAAKEYILKTLDDPAVANSPLVFPSTSDLADSHEFYVYKDYDDYQTWNSTFNPIVQS
ncbi:polyamine ABC transporter substrate-binding protein [Gryllotalpicola ginsengisoli]|uniref:polyamine ABC transporter substrate-binding protein n=1 Tax=Gryllotalpicola ginsengisoli TaxID=444608 RepID=UPI0003B66925|nr:spermidine/putrescine ABC transporter substrate-binding protein [Gryllotalpicola ginsengisoli]